MQLQRAPSGVGSGFGSGSFRFAAGLARTSCGVGFRSPRTGQCMSLAGRFTGEVRLENQAWGFGRAQGSRHKARLGLRSEPQRPSREEKSVRVSVLQPLVSCGQQHEHEESSDDIEEVSPE